MREFRDGDFPFGADFTAIARDALAGTYVASGCAVSDGGSADMNIAVDSGTVGINGANQSVNSATLSVASSDTFKRYDLAVADSDGTPDIVTGQSEKVAPAIPTDHVLLAVIEVPSGTSAISDSNIYDARVINTAPGELNNHATDTDAHHSYPIPRSGLDASLIVGEKLGEQTSMPVSFDVSGESYDSYKVWFMMEAEDGYELGLRFNGSTTDYTWHEVDDTGSDSAQEIRLAEKPAVGFDTFGGTIEIFEQQSSVAVSVQVSQSDDSFASGAAGGWGNAPVNTIDFFRKIGTNERGTKFVLYGVNY